MGVWDETVHEMTWGNLFCHHCKNTAGKSWLLHLWGPWQEGPLGER